MTENRIQSNEELLRRLHEAASRVLTKEELHRQRVSFIYGNLPPDSTITREQVEKAIARIEGDTTEAA